MYIKKSSGKIVGATMTAAERKALDIEVKRQLAEYTKKHATEIDAMFLWYLHKDFGFGVKRLKQVFTGFHPRIMELCDRYEMHEEGDTVWLCTQMLKEMGVDLEEWLKEVGG